MNLRGTWLVFLDDDRSNSGFVICQCLLLSVDSHCKLPSAKYRKSCTIHRNKKTLCMFSSILHLGHNGNADLQSPRVTLTSPGANSLRMSFNES